MTCTNNVGAKALEFDAIVDDAGAKRDISDMDDPEEDASPSKKVMVS